MTMNNLSDTARKRSITGDQLRQSFLSFFAERGHAIIPSVPLVPENDPTVLFTSAGMQPLVPYLLGESHPKGRRLASVQKCLRTDDIEEVGDISHSTFLRCWASGRLVTTGNRIRCAGRSNGLPGCWGWNS